MDAPRNFKRSGNGHDTALVEQGRDFLSHVTSLCSRVARASAEEVAQLRPRKVLAEAASHLLPHQTFNRTRTAALRAAGVTIGERSLLLGPIRITGKGDPVSGKGDPCRFLSIGADTIITGPLQVDIGAPLRIGNWVRIGLDVTLLTIGHEVGNDSFRCGLTTYGPIDIGDGAWLASRVTVLPGVTIGKASIVAAGAVVTRDVPANTMVAGVPARVVRTLE